MEICIIILFCLVLPCIVLINPIKDVIKNKKSLFKDYKEEVILFFILIVGSLVRLVAIGQFPNALNVDEASSGYDAYSIMKYGMDRGGNSYPVYLYAWGSGQSVLYSYIMIPVLMLTGLSEYGIRLPMAITGIVSLYVYYYLLKNIFDNKKVALTGLAFLAICPWHIMKSRWGMECNLFPDLILLATLLLVLGFKNKKKIFKILAFVVLAISGYSYGTSYLFLPLFVFGILGYLFYKKEVSIKEIIMYLVIMVVIDIPIMTYVIINTFDLPQIQILNITIPRMSVNRYDEISTIFSGNVYENCINNLVDTLRILLLQSDELEWNALPKYGLFYLISIVFFVIGIRASVKKYKENKFNQVMNIWMIASVILSAFCIPNINRINIIMFPCIYYISIGIFEFIDKYKTMIPCIVIIYVYLFVNFMLAYVNMDYNEYYTFTSGIEDVADYCETLNTEKIYCYYSFKEPFIYFMFYTQANVHEYLDTVQYFDEARTFDNVKSYGKYYFYLPEQVEKNDVIIVPVGSDVDFGMEYVKKSTINQFDIYEF